jgi:pimeloyl-ACP methyl ester carboxylesterase
MWVLYFIFVLLVGLFLIFDKIKRKQVQRKYNNRQDDKGRVIEVDGVNIYCIEQGRGFPLVIIHGFMSSSIDFNNVINALSGSYKIIAVDLIGFGRSDKRESINYSKKNMAVVIHKLMKQKGYNEYSVIGHSMGGGVALNIVNYYSKNVKSLVLVDSVGYKKPTRPPIPQLLLEVVFKSYLLQKFCYAMCFFNKKNLNIDKFERLYSINLNIPCQTLYTFSRTDDSESREDDKRGIKCPTLIIWGRYDRITPLQNASKFKDDIDNSKLIIFDESGHLPYEEEEEKFIRVLLDFFKTINLQS